MKFALNEAEARALEYYLGTTLPEETTPTGAMLWRIHDIIEETILAEGELANG